MPVSATTGRAEIMDAAHPGGVGGTYGGSPVACAAAIAAVEAIRQPGFLARVEVLAGMMRRTLEGWRAELPVVGDVRGLGSMLLVELVRDPATREPLPPAETLGIVRKAVARGVLLIRAGLFSNCIRFLPPLVISDSELEEGLEVVGGAICEFRPEAVAAS
jgi:4-aminobutyrate aminotransferase/(S)-3-amino-2-methylpropionate transaminase